MTEQVMEAVDPKQELFNDWLRLQGEVDWNEEIDKAALIQIEGNDFIPLAELDRLARKKGFVLSESIIVQVPERENDRQSTVTWRIQWQDGTITSSSACASWRTINKGFRNYPIEIAENRARARCIRMSLGIAMCSQEEMGPEDEDLSGPVNDQQKNLIAMLLARLEVDSGEELLEVGLEAIKEAHLDDGKFVVDRMSYEDAGKLIAELNKNGTKFAKARAARSKKNAKK